MGVLDGGEDVEVSQRREDKKSDNRLYWVERHPSGQSSKTVAYDHFCSLKLQFADARGIW